MATDTTGSLMLHTNREHAGTELIPALGGWSRIAGDGEELHTLLEDLLAQQIAKDRQINAFVGAELD